MPVFITI